jgi:hypothetical protein
MAKISADGIVRTQKTPDLRAPLCESFRAVFFHFFLNRVMCEKKKKTGWPNNQKTAGIWVFMGGGRAPHRRIPPRRWRPRRRPFPSLPRPRGHHNPLGTIRPICEFHLLFLLVSSALLLGLSSVSTARPEDHLAELLLFAHTLSPAAHLPLLVHTRRIPQEQSHCAH